MSCNTKEQASFIKTNLNEKQEKSESTEATTKPKKIGDYISDTTKFYWYTKQNDSSNYWIRLVFQKEFAVYQFHGQCIYWFFANHYYTETDKIDLLWSYKTDCLLNLDFLKKSNGVKTYPKFGDVFCEYNLVNDSVITVKYNFPDWTDKINQMENDSLFPKYFYLQQDE